jgi:hypothetical protein
MKNIILFMAFLLLISPAFSQILTLGITPSEFELYGIGQATLSLKFYNTYGETDAYYTVRADECISPYVVSGFNSDVLVPKGTTSSNAVSHILVLSGNYETKKDCFIYVYARPVGAGNQNGTVVIDRRIGIRIKMGDKPTTTTVIPTTTTKTTTTTTAHMNNPTTTTTSNSGGSGGSSGTTTSTKTTTTRTTTTSTTIGNAVSVNYPPLDNNPQVQEPIVNQQPTQEVAQQQVTQPSGGIVNFLLNTTAGFFTLVGIIALTILTFVFLIQKGKRNPRNDPLFQDNQGIMLLKY